jgi:hypothetical protein
MFRTVLTVLLALTVCAVTLSAKEYKDATVTNYDAEKNVLVAKIGDKEVTFVLTDKTSFVRANGKEIDKEKLGDSVKKMISDKRTATIVTDEKDGAEVLKDGKPVITKVTFAKKQ